MTYSYISAFLNDTVYPNIVGLALTMLENWTHWLLFLLGKKKYWVVEPLWGYTGCFSKIPTKYDNFFDFRNKMSLFRSCCFQKRKLRKKRLVYSLHAIAQFCDLSCLSFNFSRLKKKKNYVCDLIPVSLSDLVLSHLKRWFVNSFFFFFVILRSRRFLTSDVLPAFKPKIA